jgi:hypothetical protein
VLFIADVACSYSHNCVLKIHGTSFLLQDPEIGQQAGLASMETLDDSLGEKTEKLTNGEDGMESVKLDTEVRNVVLHLSQAEAIRNN